MKKIWLFLTLFMLAGLCAFAQAEQKEKKVAIGVGPEWNMNSRHNFAMGGAMALDFKLPNSFAIGLNFGASYNFKGITVMEPSGMFRWYFLGSGKKGFFVQADLGAFLIFEESELTIMFLGGLRSGIRIPLGKSFYVEPFGRLGYPFAFGIGVMAGFRF